MFFRAWRPHHLLKVTRQGFVGTLFECFLPPGRCYSPLVPLWCHFVRFLGPLGPILDPSWTMLALSGAIFGSFWNHFVSSWLFLVPSGTIFGPF